MLVSGAMAERPDMLGLRHLALWVAPDAFSATARFYTEAMGFEVDWQPDDANVYLTSGGDNLALHRADQQPRSGGALDHIGFAVASSDAVYAWHAYLHPLASQLGFEVLNPPKQHRDGATSFYLRDPARHQLQLLHIPSLRP